MIIPFVASLTHNARIIPDLILIILTGGLWILIGKTFQKKFTKIKKI